MAVTLQPVITRAGVEAALLANQQSIAFNITHISFGETAFTPTGNETSLPQERLKVAIESQNKLNDKSFKIRAKALANRNNAFVCKAIGFWAGSTLFAVYSQANLPSSGLMSIHDSVETLISCTLVLSQLEANRINVSVDLTNDRAMQLLQQHIEENNPHPQYAPKDLDANSTTGSDQNGHSHKLPQASFQIKGITQLYTGYDSQREDCALTPKTAFNLKSLIDANGRRFDGFIPLSKKSNAVDSTSSDTVATSYAAKLAYDKGVEAKTAADNAQTAADNAQRTANAKQSPASTLSGYGIEDFKIKEAESGANANNFKEDGHYYFASGSNLPGEGSWHMQVIAGSHSREVRQIAKKTGSLETYERTFHKPTFGSGSWKAWKRTDTDGLPLGSVMAFPKQIANPQGFLLADGSTFNQQTYPDLYRSLGNSNKLPNLQRSDVGMLAYFPVDNIPQGWLECNGNGINREAFPELYDMLAPKYGTFPQSGLTWARLPNGEDRFIRSAGNGLRVGDKQEDEIKKHTHKLISYHRDNSENASLYGTGFEFESQTNKATVDTWGDNTTHDNGWITPTLNSKYATGGTETRPKSIVFKLCIKALNGFDDVKFWIKAFGEVQNAGAMDASRLAQDIQAVRREKAELQHTHRASEIPDFSTAVEGMFSYQKIGNFEVHKFPNGTMIQTVKIALPDSHVNGAPREFNWAIAFSETPHVAITLEGTDDWRNLTVTPAIMSATSTNAKCSYKVIEWKDQYQPNIQLVFTAIGRWK